MDKDAQVADAILAGFVSTEFLDDNLMAGNAANALYHIAKALGRIADALERLDEVIDHTDPRVPR